MGYLENRAGLFGKTAVIVGGGSGVGAAVTLALARAGVDVAFCDIKENETEATRTDVEQLGRRALCRVVDALDYVQLEGFYRAFGDAFDRLDIVVNVVGGVVQRSFSDGTPEQWAHDIERNFGYVLHSTSYALPHLRAGGRGGSIINFTTIEAHRGAAGFAVYAGAKAGLTNFSRALALELGPEQIRVNLIAPDTTPSEGSMRAVPFAASPNATPMSFEFVGNAMAAYIPLGAPPPQEALGDAVLFLASDLSSSVTGTTLHVDGGTWAASGFQHWPGPQGWLPVVPFGLLRPDAFD